jgi:thiamine biosynthesis lipoprotein
MRPSLQAGVLLVAVALAAGCAGTEAPRTVEFSGLTMGSTWSVKVVPPAEGLAAEAAGDVSASIRNILDRIDTLMSTWKPESELSRFNVSSSTEPFEVAPETYAVFALSKQIHEDTGGAFDPTIGPLIDAWGFGVDRDVAPPDEATVARLMSSTGMALVELDPAGRWVRKVEPGVRVDFSAIAPGYAADLIADDLVRRGLSDFLVDVGGELVGHGTNERGEPWQIGVERPQQVGRAVARVVPIADQALATSGDYRNFREIDGERFTHILDPRAGRPVHHTLASVTVVAERAGRADALATALMVMGPAEAPAFAAAHGIAALFLIRRPDGSFEEEQSPAFGGAPPVP